MGRILKSQKGFTLVEVLCALAIMGVSVGVFSTGIIAAASINQNASDSQAALMTELQSAEGMGGTPAGRMSVSFRKISSGGALSSPFASVNVELYQAGSSDALTAYELP